MTMAGFELFVVFYVPMCVVIGYGPNPQPNRQPPHRLLQPLCSPIAARGVRSVAAAAISASAWPFVVPMLLSFDIFLEDDEGNPTEFPIFDAVLLSIAIGASSSPPALRPARAASRRARRAQICATRPCSASYTTGRARWTGTPPPCAAPSPAPGLSADR